MMDVLTRLFEPDVLIDPSEFYRWVRETHPVYRHPKGFFLMSSHANALWMFRSQDLRGLEPDDYPTRCPNALKYRVLALLLDGVGNTNPPKHTRLRRLLSRDFTLRRIRELRPSAERICERLVADIEEPLRDGEVVDLHTRLTRPLAMQVIAEMIGVPPEDRSALTPLVARILTATHPAATEAVLDAAEEASNEVEQYMLDLIAQRRANPADDLTSALVSTHDDDPDQLSDHELISWVWGLWAGGFETTSAAQDNAAVILLDHPQHARVLHERPKDFVNECLRYEPPSLVTGVVRIAARDVRVGDVVIPEGSDVRTMTGCANRDPAVFPDADRFDPDRDTTASLTFGGGLHYCLGAHLARTQVEVMLPRLHTRFGGLEPAGPPVRRRTLPLRACDALPVRLRRAA
jgi:cytochrome P450 family 114